MRLVLIRHGQTDWNKEYRVQGQADLPLNESGRAQAEATARFLQDEPLEVIYSSPLSRAYETALAITRFRKIDIITESRLKELDVGEADGLYYPNLKTKYPDFFRVWTTDPALIRWPGGESLPELQVRVWGVVQHIISQRHSESVAIISHFFVLLALLCKVFGLSLSDFRKLNIGVASISVVEFVDGKARLVSLNETCHLE